LNDFLFLAGPEGSSRKNFKNETRYDSRSQKSKLCV
jgi:hypothetical protein